MKRKTLLYLLALVVMLPCAFLLTACTIGGSSDNNGGGSNNKSKLTIKIETMGADNVCFKDIDEDDADGTSYYEIERRSEFSVWVRDYCDKDTLKVYLDGEDVDLTYVVDENEYANKQICMNLRKIATFKLSSDLKGKHTITYSIDEETIAVRFVEKGQFSKYDEAEKKALKEWYFVNNDGSMSDSFYDILSAQANDNAEPYTINIPFSKVGNDTLQYSCSKPVGYYNYFFFEPVNEDVYTANGVAYLEEKTISEVRYSYYSSRLQRIGSGDMYDSSYAKDEVIDFYIESKFDSNTNTAVMGLSQLNIRLAENHSQYLDYTMFMIKNGDLKTSAGATMWTAENENDIKVYFEHHDGVDFSNLRAYVYNQEMTICEDGDDRYFVIEKGKLPVDYCPNEDDVDWFLDIAYLIKVEGVEIENGTFAVVTATTNMDDKYSGFNFTYLLSPIAYYWQDGITYCIQNNDLTVVFGGMGDIEESLVSMKFNNETIDMTPIASYRTDLPKHESGYEGSDTLWQDEQYPKNFCYKVTTSSGVDLFLNVAFDDYGDEDWRMCSIHMTFNITENTNIQLVFGTNN